MRQKAGILLISIFTWGWAVSAWAGQETGWIQSPGANEWILQAVDRGSAEAGAGAPSFLEVQNSREPEPAVGWLQKYADSYDKNTSNTRSNPGGSLGLEATARNSIRVARLLLASA